MSTHVASVTAATAGTITLGGEATVNRLGFGAMRLTGSRSLGSSQRSPGCTSRSCVGQWSWTSTLSTPQIHTAQRSAKRSSPKPCTRIPRASSSRPKAGGTALVPASGRTMQAPSTYVKQLRAASSAFAWIASNVYQLHTPDPAISFDASVETLAQLKAEGKIHLIGLSNVTREHIERARKNYANRLRAEPLQRLRPRMGTCRRLLRTKWPRIYSMVPAGRRRSGPRRFVPYRASSSCQAHSDRKRLAFAAFSRNATDSRHFVGRTSRGKHRRGGPASKRR
jgi:hypothetical protein